MADDEMAREPERQPLLRPRSASRGSRVSKSGGADSASVLWRVAPCILIGAFEVSITTSTFIDIFRRATCKIWYLVNNPEAIPKDGRLPDEMCRLGQRHSPEAYFASFITIFALSTGLAHFITSSAIAKFSKSLGRRPAFLALCILDVVSGLLIVLSITSDSPSALWVLLIAILISLFCGPLVEILPATMMIVDVTDATARTSALSRLQGALWLGLAPGFALGGYLTVALGPKLTVSVAAALSVVNLVYAIIFLPETLTTPEILEVQDGDAELAQDRRQESFLRRLLDSFAAPFSPLKQLAPRRDQLTGRRNSRLLLFGTGLAIYTIGTGYLGQILVVYSTNQLYFNAQDTGWLLTILQSVKVIYLLFFLPTILTLGRRMYMNPATSEPSSNTEALEGMPSVATEKMSNHFDVHLIIGSWLYELVIFIALAFAGTKSQFTFFASSATLGVGWTAAFDSATVASVGRLESGEVLSAMIMIKSIFEVVSSLLLGNVLVWSVGVLPNLVFFIIAGCVGLAAFIVFFIKDSDRHSE